MSKRTDEFGPLCTEILTRIREQHPLVHHMTNYVVMNYTADAALALGSLPVMAHAREEVAEMVDAAGSRMPSPVTLDAAWVEAMLIAGRRANELGGPVVYDPVGIGATQLCIDTGRRFMPELRVVLVRGDWSEVGALARQGRATQNPPGSEAP